MGARFGTTFVLAVLATAAGASAGDEPSAANGRERNAVSFQAGLSSGSSQSSHMAGAAVGGTLVRDLSSRLALEATGSFLNRGMGENGLNLSASLLVNLRHGREKAVPYLAVGGGVYRASFDMGNSRFTGPMGYGGMMGYGMMGGAGMMGGGPYDAGRWNYGQMPMFYGRRMGPADQDGRASGHRSFTDPAMSVGGGFKVDLGSRLSLRPDARALVVASGGDTYTLGLFTVNFGYRF